MLNDFIKQKKKQSITKIVNKDKAENIRNIITSNSEADTQPLSIHSPKRKSLGDITNGSDRDREDSLHKRSFLNDSLFDSECHFPTKSDILDESDFSNLSKKPFENDDSGVFMLSSDLSEASTVKSTAEMFKNFQENSKDISENSCKILPAKSNIKNKSKILDIAMNELKRNKVDISHLKNKEEVKVEKFSLEMNEIKINKIIPKIEQNDKRMAELVGFSSKISGVPYSSVSAALYLPQNLKKLSTLYKIILLIYNFNQKRHLELIYTKCKASIESLFKHRVEISYLEQLNYILGDSIAFVPVKLENEETFNIKIIKESDIDKVLFDFYIKKYEEWLGNNGITCKYSRIADEFKREVVEVPVKPFLKSNEAKAENIEIKKIVKSKAESIFERIKEKERLRREEFIKAEETKDDCGSKLESIFLVSKKKAIKLTELIFQIGGLNSRERILKNCGDKFYVKIIQGEEYLMMK